MDCGPVRGRPSCSLERKGERPRHDWPRVHLKTCAMRVRARVVCLFYGCV